VACPDVDSDGGKPAASDIFLPIFKIRPPLVVQIYLALFVRSLAVTKAVACRFSMGLLSAVVVPLSEQLSTRSLGVVVAAGLFSFCVLAVVFNVLNQLLFRNSNEPPVVFHWFPVFGSTIIYGIDPYKFFFNCQKKVYCANLPPYSKSVD